MNVRSCALTILDDFDRRPTALESIIDRAFSGQKMDHRDKRLVFEIVYGIIRHQLTLDYVLKHFLLERRFAQNGRLMRILRIGMYQIVYLDRIPDHAAVNESVKLAKKDKSTIRMSGVINAVLRKIIAHKKKLPKPTESEPLADRLSVTYSHPAWFIRRWLDRYGLGNTKKLLGFFNRHPSVFLRRKIKGLSRQQFESDARAICGAACSGQGYKNLYYLLQKSILPENIGLLKEGYCTVQAESSGWVVAMLDIKKGDKVLDVCSAPGGKMSLMAELAGENGAVCACELRFARMKKVCETVVRMNLSNVYSVVSDGAALPFTGSFDKVLLDAPCTGTGVMHRHPEARWIKRKQDIERCVTLQRRLLEGVVPFVIPQGILVYATCSLEPEENHHQVAAFLKRHPEFVLEKPFGLVTDTYRDNEGYLSVTPHEHTMDGMFAARMRKIAG